jgi:hypothetical protein
MKGKAMHFTRRNFLVGGASAFGAFGAFGGNRFFAASAGSAASGNRKPNLRFGLLSDIHIDRVGANEKMSMGGNILTVKHAFEWFRDANVDAVVIAGDLANLGLGEQLVAVAEAWYSVFPDDRRRDGSRVERVFVTGNHDWVGHTYYGGLGAKKYPDEVERAKHLLQKDMAGWWDRAFHEPYSPIYSKTVKGYTFIGSHWDGVEARLDSYDANFDRIEDFMAKNGKKIDPSLPFFYVQHPHLKDTCYGPWAWGHDNGITTKTLSAYPNAIALSGHSHYSITDERSIWQGAFTSVGAGSLRYTTISNTTMTPQGERRLGAAFENDRGNWKVDARKIMPVIGTGDCRQGMLWSVYDECIVVNRREFLSGLDLGEDWILPLPAAEPRPFAFAEHAKKFRAPEFPKGSKPVIAETVAKSRGGKSRNGSEVIPSEELPAISVTVPPVVPDNRARLFTLEFVAKTADGRSQTKLVVPEGYNHSLKHDKAKTRQTCYFRKDELGEGVVRFSVTPMNCFGARGRSIEASYGG